MTVAKATGRGRAEMIDRFAGGVGWLAHPEETMQRASHALVTDGGVLVVDPIDAVGMDQLVAEYGTVSAVVVLSNYHRRDAVSVARRHDVPVVLPASMRLELDGPTVELGRPPGAWRDGAVAADPDAGDSTEVRAERDPESVLVWRWPVGTELAGYELFRVRTVDVAGRGWQEYALYDGTTLVCADSIGTAPYQRVADERVGVSLLTRALPPRRLLACTPERLLVGHGTGVFEDATAALVDAIVNARRRLPQALLANGRDQCRALWAAVTT